MLEIYEYSLTALLFVINIMLLSKKTVFISKNRYILSFLIILVCIFMGIANGYSLVFILVITYSAFFYANEKKLYIPLVFTFLTCVILLIANFIAMFMYFILSLDIPKSFVDYTIFFLITGIISVSFSIITEKHIVKKLELFNINRESEKLTNILILIHLVFFIILYLNIILTKYVNTIIVPCATGIFIIMIFILLYRIFKLMNNLNINKIKNDTLLYDYSEISKVLDSHKEFKHKNQNIFISLLGYIENEDYIGLKEYYNYILKEMKTLEHEKSGLTEISKISILPLRAIVESKIIIANLKKIKTYVKIESNINEVENTYDFVNIVGELLDNAIVATSKSKEPMITLDIYEENNFLKIKVYNTFYGKLNLGEIFNKGTTENGYGRGVGLYFVKKTVDKYNYMDIRAEIIDNIFLVEITYAF